MVSVFRTYRVPLSATALIILALISWAWQDWRNFAEHVQQSERHRAIGVFRMLAGAIYVLEENGRPKREEIKRIVEHI